jgi:tetratricopeptide (TPR) repeat protein
LQRQLTKADDHFHHGLQIATQLEDLWLITIIRTALGRLAVTSANEEHGQQQYQQALEVARQSGDRFLIINILTNLALLVIQQGDFQQAGLLAEEYLTLSQQIGAKLNISFALLLLGRIALQEKQYPRASELMKRSLQLVWSTRDQDSTLETLVHLVDYEAEQGNFEIAARILGACEVAVTNFPAGHRLPNQTLFDQWVETLQARLEPGVFTAAWTLGRLMSLEQAVSFALIDHSSDATRRANL